jgi:DNA-binding transcriptional MerR regulator
MDNNYSTKEVADIIGVHPNTVRMYEDIGFISKPVRKKNGYRVFTGLHV